MAQWHCTECNFSKESRCKPKKCPECQGKDTFEKREASEEEEG